MTIHINNYHNWLNALEMGVLTPDEEETLMLFLEANPQLLDACIDEEFPKLEPNEIVFENKSMLLKSETGFDGMNPFDFLAVKSIEEGLTEVEEVGLNQYIASIPQHHRDFILYQATRLKSDLSVVFTDKQRLKHSILINTGWWQGVKYAAAAAVIAGMVWFLWPAETIVQHQPMAKVIQSNSVVNEPLQVASKSLVAVAVVKKPVENVVQSVSPPAVDSVGLMAEKMDVAFLTPKDANSVLPSASIEGADILAGVGMSDNFIELLPQSDIEYAMRDIDEEQLHRSNRLSLRLLERGVMLVNFLGVSDVKFNKYYDNNGNVMAYQLIGDGFQWDQKVK